MDVNYLGKHKALKGYEMTSFQGRIIIILIIIIMIVTSVYIYKSVWDLIGIVRNLQTIWESRHILESLLHLLLFLSTLALLECRLLPRDEACSAVWSLSRVETRSGQTKTRSLRRLLEGDERLWFRTLQGPTGTVIHWHAILSSECSQPCQALLRPSLILPSPCSNELRGLMPGPGFPPHLPGKWLTQGPVEENSRALAPRESPSLPPEAQGGTRVRV